MTKDNKKPSTRYSALSDDPRPVSSQRIVLSRLRFRQWRAALGGIAAIFLVGGGVVGWEVWTQYRDIVSGLPTVSGLRSYQPPVMSRIYAGDDHLVAELASERRVFIPYTAIPDRVKNAFLAAEDRNFWVHKGVDPFAIMRAALTDLVRGRGHRPIGASTITQQVARIMLLGSNEVSIRRKAREAFLALRIEQVLPKEKILEIYLNEIYLGNGAYGIEAAAETYFGKPLDQLDNAQAAFLAALPKSPTNYNPERFPKAAINRRNWVLERMVDTGALSLQEARAAEAEPLDVRRFIRTGPAPGSEWFAEEVRRELINRYGQEVTMQGGLSVHTSLDLSLQRSAQAILRQGLMDYDRVHRGWLGPVYHFSGFHSGVAVSAWTHALSRLTPPLGMLDQWRLAIVLDAARGQVGWREGVLARRNIGGTAQIGIIQAKDMAWAKRQHPLHDGDVVMIEPQAVGGHVALRQIPEVEGAVVTLNAHTGRVLALVGGWSFRESQFDRATQAMRQPGSSFKPFVYLVAMQRGLSPSQVFDDAPISYGTWHPNNYEKDFWGPTTLHDALRESRNLVTIRLAAFLGMKNVADMAEKLGLVSSMPLVLPAALGAVETTALKEAGAYATLAIGGRRVTPTFIDDVRDRTGRVIWRAQTGLSLTSSVPQASGGGKQTEAKTLGISSASLNKNDLPEMRDDRPSVATPQSTFQVTTMLQDVIRRGTGRRAGEGINYPIAGKTGTSQNFNDAWFSGYSPDIVTIVWIGFDTPHSLGKHETGGIIAGPIWNKIMKVVLNSQPQLSFIPPEGITLVQYNTGRGVTVDAFKDDQVPGRSNTLSYGSQELSALDTGAENVPDSESDMAEGDNNIGGKSVMSEHVTVPQRPSNDGIGMGGLY